MFYEKDAEAKGFYNFSYGAGGDTYAHFHGAKEFFFVKKGSITAVLDGETRVIGAGEAYFADGFCIHSYSDCKNTETFLFMGAGDIFEGIFKNLGGKPPKFFKFCDYDLLFNLFSVCEREYKDEKTRLTVFEGAARILMGAISQTVPFTEGRSEKGEKTVVAILKYAEDNLSGDLSLESVAEKFGYSKEHLSRLLHKYLSENWKSYIGRIRVKTAKKMLEKNPEDSVLKIAMDCGFDSANTFYRAYKREFGENPKRNKRG